MNTSLMAFLIDKRLLNLSCGCHNRLTFYALRRTISNLSVSNFHDCVSRSCLSVRKPNFVLLPVLLAVSSLIHYKFISSWINGRFTGLITSILNEFSAFSILGEVSRSRTLRCTWCKCNWQLLAIDACLHTAAQKWMVYVIPCTFWKLYYEFILIYNFEQKYHTTCSVGAKLFVYSILFTNFRNTKKSSV